MITVFLPCRAGSERVPQKNTKPFASEIGGLLSLKIKELLKVKLVDTIVVSTNDIEVKRIVRGFTGNIILDDRPDNLPFLIINNWMAYGRQIYLFRLIYYGQISYCYLRQCLKYS